MDALLLVLGDRIKKRNYPFAVEFEIVSTEPGCIKGKIVVYLVVALQVVDYAAKYKDLRESLPLMFDDGKAMVCEVIRNQKIECPAWLQAGQVSEYLHTVQQGESLSSIVAKWRISGATPSQVMTATFRRNAHAFIGGDINKIKAGETISSPTVDSLRQIRQ